MGEKKISLISTKPGNRITKEITHSSKYYYFMEAYDGPCPVVTPKISKFWPLIDNDTNNGKIYWTKCIYFDFFT